MKTMKDAKVGEQFIVKKIHGEGALRRRIMDMGITRGTQINVVKNAPLGDPMELELRGYHLSLRRKDAELVEVE
jgi:ferrous iron transport protein A